MDTLTTLEAIGTDNKDRPVQDIILEKASVFVDPFAEVEEELTKEREAEIEKNKPTTSKPVQKEERKVFTGGVGKYINPVLKKEARKTEEDNSAVKKKTEDDRRFRRFQLVVTGERSI